MKQYLKAQKGHLATLREQKLEDGTWPERQLQ